MNPDRWRRIETLVEAAAAREGDARAAFLAEACGDDAELRREVESLLAEQSGAEKILATGAWRPPALAPGTRLGPHEVLELIGAGGMGEVYKARDTRLERTVAIKVLPSDRAGDPERRHRFEREAKTISALNHSHICVLYDVGEANLPSPDKGVGVVSGPTLQYLVMEYLEGETLAARLDRGAVHLGEALRISAEIAEALAYAHHRGVVHRDLKPGNVMLTASGVKLLDFGLAKFIETTAHAALLNAESTETLTLVGERKVQGTLPYMAPEQVEGKPADARTDLWALGCVLYEMIAGRRAFEGATSASLAGAILHAEPVPLPTLEPATPSTLDHVVRKCLAKSPEDRWDTAHDVLEELRWIASGSDASEQRPLAAKGRPSKRHWLWVAAVAALSAATAGVVWRTWRQWSPATVLQHVSYRQVTFSGDVLRAALSSDGRTVAYATRNQTGAILVMLRDLQGGQTLQVWKGAELFTLDWTPDGTEVLLSGITDAGVEALLVPRFGGEPRRLTGFEGLSSGLRRGAALLTVSPDGTSLAGAYQDERGFRVVPVSGGEAHAVALPRVRFTYDIRWGPANRVAVVSQDEDDATAVWTVAPDGSKPRRVYVAESESFSFCWSSAPGEFYVQRIRNGVTELVSLRDSEQAAAASEVVVSKMPRAVTCDVSRDGQHLLQLRSFGFANLWRVDLHEVAASPTAITKGTANLVYPRISPDGQFLAVTRSSGSKPEIVKIPVAGGDPIVLTDGYMGAWSRDGSRLAFFSDDDGGVSRIWVADAYGQGATEIRDATLGQPNLVWLPDGRLAWPTPDARNWHIRDLANGREELLLLDASVGFVFSPRFSPKGARVAVAWNRKEAGLWVLAWPARVGRRVSPGVSQSQSVYPIGWSADGRWIYGQQGANDIVKVGVKDGSIEPVVRFPAGTIAGCDLSSDADTLVCAVAEWKRDAWLAEDFDPRSSSMSR